MLRKTPSGPADTTVHARAGRLGRVEARSGGQPVVALAFWRGLAIFRPLAALYAGVVVWRHLDQMQRPWLAWATIAVLLAWSTAMAFLHVRPVVLVIEAALGVTAILLSRLAYLPHAVSAGGYTLPTLWVAGTVVGVAVWYGWRGGLLSALLVIAADLVEVGRPTGGTIHNIVLLLLLGGLIGLAVDLARDGLDRYEAAMREQERLRERERLARVVHDGVLQSLTWIHRRGGAIGGEAIELALMASEQERALRRFIVDDTDPDAGGEVDIRSLLLAHENATVTVAVPAEPVSLPSRVARELDAAVTAALTNVDRHAGTGAKAWVLLEDAPEDLQVVVRDNGRGCEPEEFDRALERGRFGVAHSIRGRVADLGGDVAYSTKPGAGCRVTLRLPKEAR